MDPASEVSVWTASRDIADQMLPMLSDEQRSRADGFRSVVARDLYVTAYGMLRSLLAARTGTPPQDLAIERRQCPRCREPHGKPFLSDDPSITFNLSHSGGLAAVAVASRREVGVDVEDLSKRRDIPRLAARTLSAEERRAFDASGEDPACFLRLWTRKEALLKATGAGLTQRLFDVSVSPTQPIVDFNGTWTLIDLDLPATYVGTVAVEGAQAEVRLHAWDPSS